MKLKNVFPVLLLVAGCAAEEDALTESAADGTGQSCRNLLDRVTSPTGSTVEFCAVDGVVAVIERASLHTHAYVNELERHWRCPSDLYSELTRGAPVPSELLEDCRQRTESGRTPRTVEPPPLVAPEPSLRSHLCASGTGDDDFIEEKCDAVQANAAGSYWYDSMWWCHAVPSTETQRTATSQLGHKADKIRAVLASCAGTSNYKLKHYTGGWDTEVDTDVLSGFWIDGSLYTDLIDQDLRFNGDAYGSAWYRNAGMFGDFEFP
jgi:hypothetical protein